MTLTKKVEAALLINCAIFCSNGDEYDASNGDEYDASNGDEYDANLEGTEMINMHVHSV